MIEALKDTSRRAALRGGGWGRCGKAFRQPRVVMAIRAEAERRGLL